MATNQPITAVYSNLSNPPEVFNSGMQIKGHLAVGNFAKIDQITSEPGTTPTDVYSGSMAAIINERFMGDLSRGDDQNTTNGGALIYSGLSHTGTGNASFVNIDTELTINADATGPFNWLSANQAFLELYGTGHVQDVECISASIANHSPATIDFMAGLTSWTRQNGSGAIAEMYGVWSAVGASAGSPATKISNLRLGFTDSGVTNQCQDFCQIEIENCAGYGSATSYNIHSIGANSINLFDGIVRLGTATNASPQNGDLWFDGTNLKFRTGGVTKTVTLT